MRKKKQSFELTFDQTEMLGKFGDASFAERCLTENGNE
jgi:hypothetical protein